MLEICLESGDEALKDAAEDALDELDYMQGTLDFSLYNYDVDDDEERVHIDLTLTSPGCPLGPVIIRDIQRELQALGDILDVDVDLVWSPLWHPTMMSDYAKDELGYDDEFGLGLGHY